MSLTPSQRVTLMKEISERLSTEGWSLIDATLAGFSISIPEDTSWGVGTEASYILYAIRKAGDQILVDLAEHLGHTLDHATPAQLPTRTEPKFWHKGFLRLFISHLAKNKVYAAELQDALFSYGISGFVAHNDIEPTLEWQTEIEVALATCDSLVALLHDGFHASRWTDQEIGFAMGRGVPAFSVQLDEAPYGFIARFQAFNGNHKTAKELARELFDALRKKKGLERKMSDALIQLFEESHSFAEARDRTTYLNNITAWDPSYSARLRAAVKTNDQINGSFGVPQRVESFIQRRESKAQSASAR